jgi:tetratricopeptide (TPR) repeat protein
MTKTAEQWSGRAVVGTVMATAIILTGCDAPGGSRAERTSNPRLPVERQTTVRPAAVVTETVTPVPAPVVEAPRPVPATPWGHYLYGIEARQAGDLVTAERAFTTALEGDPIHIKSLVNLARTLVDLDRPQEALVVAERAVTLEPGLADAHRLRGRAFAELGQEIDAIAAYRDALLHDAQDAWSANNLGLLHILGGRINEAVGPLALAVQLRPDVSLFRNNLGIALERVGALGQAAEQYQAAADAGHPRAAVSLERVLARHGEGDLVIDLTMRAEDFLYSLAPVVGDIPPHESRRMAMLWDSFLNR